MTFRVWLAAASVIVILCGIARTIRDIETASMVQSEMASTSSRICDHEDIKHKHLLVCVRRKRWQGHSPMPTEGKWLVVELNVYEEWSDVVVRYYRSMLVMLVI